jgi:hypothetical protein
MSIFDEKDYEEYIHFKYYSRDSQGSVVAHEYRIDDEIVLDPVVHTFMNMLQSVFSWDRKDIRGKVLEAVDSWDA